MEIPTADILQVCSPEPSRSSALGSDLRYTWGLVSPEVRALTRDQKLGTPQAQLPWPGLWLEGYTRLDSSAQEEQTMAEPPAHLHLRHIAQAHVGKYPDCSPHLPPILYLSHPSYQDGLQQNRLKAAISSQSSLTGGLGAGAQEKAFISCFHPLTSCCQLPTCSSWTPCRDTVRSCAPRPLVWRAQSTPTNTPR